jgi:ankyrin repeat protein
VSVKLKHGILAALALGLVAVPAGAQKFSDSFTFLKSVRERDGGEVERLLVVPGSTVINTKDMASGEGGLHIVTRGRDLNWLTFLLGKGARPDLQNKDGVTALAMAAQLGWADGAEMLLRARANVDLPNKRGETPLILAVQNRDLAMVRLLLSKGANPKRTDSAAGYSAIDYARQDKRAAAILKLLEAPPVRANTKEAAGPKL